MGRRGLIEERERLKLKLRCLFGEDISSHVRSRGPYTEQKLWLKRRRLLRALG
jgi:hypothetical protein